MIEESFPGFWRLESFEQRLSGGTIYPFGEKASGLIMYDASGLMGVHIVRDPMAVFSNSETFDPFEEPPYSNEFQGNDNRLGPVFESYLAYFGAYTIDWVGGTITHIVQGSNRPGFVNRKLVRAFQFSGDLLRLSPPSDEHSPVILVWRRVSHSPGDL